MVVAGRLVVMVVARESIGEEKWWLLEDKR